MRRRLFCAALGLACLGPLAARAAGPEHGIEPGTILRGGFVQERRLKGFNAPLRSEGHFVLVPGRGLIWSVERPFAITTVITAAGLVQQVDGSETMRLASASLPFLSHLYDMLGGALSGDWHALETDFSVQRTGDPEHWQVNLTPRRTDDTLAMPFASIAATGGRFVDQVTLTKSDGDSDVLSFTEQQVGTGPFSADETAAFDRAVK
jgi:Outer membrane lipoprotein carrier protein LolA-like